MMESISPQMNTHGNTHVPVALLEKAVLSSSYGYVINDLDMGEPPEGWDNQIDNTFLANLG